MHDTVLSGVRTINSPNGLLLGFCSLAGAAQTSPPSVPATLIVNGDISSSLTLKADDLANMLREILKRAGAPLGKDLRGKALTSYILAKAHDHQVPFTLAEVDPAFADEHIVVADKRNGKALFGYQGPFRLVCPGDKAGARSVRMLETLEVVRLQK